MTRRPIRPIHEQGVFASPNRRSKWEAFNDDVVSPYILLGLFIAVWPIAKAIGWVVGERQ